MFQHSLAESTDTGSFQYLFSGEPGAKQKAWHPMKDWILPTPLHDRE